MCGAGARLQLVALNLMDALANNAFGMPGKYFSVGASLGLRMFRGGADTIESILRDADAACYVAKRNGRNRVEIHQPSGRRESSKPISGLHAIQRENQTSGGQPNRIAVNATAAIRSTSA